MTHFTLWNEKCLQSKRRRWTYARYDGTHFEFVLCDELCRVSCMWLFVRVVSVFLWFVLRWLCFGMWKEETATRASMVLCMENLTHLSFRFILFSAWPGYHNNWRNCSSVLFLPMSQFRKNHNFYHTFGREISREYHTGSDDWASQYHGVAQNLEVTVGMTIRRHRSATCATTWLRFSGGWWHWHAR